MLSAHIRAIFVDLMLLMGLGTVTVLFILAVMLVWFMYRDALPQSTP